MGKDKIETLPKLKLTRRTILLMAAGAAAFLLPICAYMLVFWLGKGYTLGQTIDWAHFATFVSGIATPFLAFCSILLFTHSIDVQREEMRDTRRELAHSRKVNEQSLQRQQELHSEQLLVSHIEKRIVSIESAVESIRWKMTEIHGNADDSENSYRPPDDLTTLVVDFMESVPESMVRDEIQPLLEEFSYCCKLLSRFFDKSEQLYIYEKILDDAECFADQIDSFVRYAKYDDDWINQCYDAIRACIEIRHERGI